MDIRAISLIRNERDIWPYVLERALQLFDHIYVVDHQSTDGTEEITKFFANAYPKAISRFALRQQGYYQNQVSNRLARRAFEDGADWVLFLDADEFYRVNDRAGLEDALATHAETVVSFVWRNLLPSEFGSFCDFPIVQRYFTLNTPSTFSKVSISAPWATRFPTFQISMGNHGVAPWRGAQPIAGPPVGEILHVPVRSLERLAFKIDCGISAYEAKANKSPNEGHHWYTYGSF
ncbi:glycosyltransferase family 2 protein [Methyloceanibacter marginalis]|uniref:glycosyltransferase family 2 protein n=1 Tax=Methyloceanibacter marginalis TaxID=1774971 RepID=UPI001301554C|nr:glycosyltransferase family 2 protein [Methyloceanibacter marginalis]